MSQKFFSLDLRQLSVVAACLSVIAYAMRLIYNGYFHPLAKFPGPLLAGMARWYETVIDLKGPEGGQYMYKIRRMHEKYGPIVRISPNELHINDATYREVLYSNSQKRDKVPYMVDIFGAPLAIFGTKEHELHRLRRSALNPFFSKQSIQNLEDVILEKVQKMCCRVDSFFRDSRTIHLHHILTACIVDVTTEFSFAKCANVLEEPDCGPRWTEMILGVSEAAPVARAFPGIVQVLQSLPIWLVRMMNPLMASFAEFDQFIRSEVERVIRQRSETPKTALGLKDRKAKTIFQEILNSTLPEHEKTVDRMTQDAVAVVSAASETTTSVLTTIIYYVASDPVLQSRLFAELCTVMPNPTSDVKWKTLEQLPFLSALIKEGLRLTVPICSRLPMIAREPLSFNEWTIPAGTYIGMSIGDALLHPEIYPDPLTFRPERWMMTDTLPLTTVSPTPPEETKEQQGEEDTERRQRRRQMMQTAFVPFNRGPRMCIGMHLAYANMYIILAALFRRFELEVDTDATVRERDLDCVRDYFVSKPSRKSRGVLVGVMSERT